MTLQKVSDISSDQQDLTTNIKKEIGVVIEELGGWDVDTIKVSLFDLEEYCYDETPNLRRYIKYHEPEIQCNDIIILHC